MLVVLSYVRVVYVRSINEIPPPVCTKLEIILFSFHCRVIRQPNVESAAIKK